MRHIRRFAVAFLVLMLVGCASERVVRLYGGATAPAAQGTVKSSKGPNDNLRLKISVQHLAPPDRLAPGATVFVVWARPARQGGIAQNLGALKIDKDLTGTLETVTPLQNFDLLITPESSAEVQSPSNISVLMAHLM